MCCDVIKCGCDALYSLYDVIQIGVWCHTYKGCDNIERVGVMTQIQWLWRYKYSKCDVIYNVYDVVIHNGWDLINTFGVISSNSGGDDSGSVDTISNTVGVMSKKWWFDVIKWGCDVIYSAKDAIHMASVMSYKDWVWCQYSGCDDTE